MVVPKIVLSHSVANFKIFIYVICIFNLCSLFVVVERRKAQPLQRELDTRLCLRFFSKCKQYLMTSVFIIWCCFSTISLWLQFYSNWYAHNIPTFTLYCGYIERQMLSQAELALSNYDICTKPNVNLTWLLVSFTQKPKIKPFQIIGVEVFS